MGELGVHSGALMADHHIKDMEFADSVLKAAAAVSSDITMDDKKGRRDLTKEDVHLFTIGELPEGNSKRYQ
jgi:protein SSD1